MNWDAATVKLLLDYGADPAYRSIGDQNSLGPGYSPFDLAAFNVDLETIQLLLPYASPWEIIHALPTAVSRHNRQLVQTLLAQGADPNAYYYSLSAVALAAHSDNVEILKDLIAAGASREGEAGGMAMYGAAWAGNLAAVKLLLAQGVPPEGYTKTSPLVMATYTTRWQENPVFWEIVRVLLAAGASAAGSDGDGATPLMVAIEQNQLDLAGPLIEHGSDPNSCSQAGDSAMALAAGQGQPALVRLLLESGARVDLAQVCARQPYKVPPLVAAIQSKNIETVQILLASGASANTCTEAGISPLSVAAESGNPALLRLILAAGTRLELAENCAAQPYQMPPLAAAARSNNPQAVELLIAAGAHPNTASPALAQARSNEVMNLLLAAGADLEARGFGGATPLLARAAVGEAAQLQHFLAAGADPKARDYNGWTALDHAAWNGNPEALKLFKPETVAAILAACYGHAEFLQAWLQAGGNPNTQDEAGRSLLSLVVTGSFQLETSKDLVNSLIAAGAEVDAPDRLGKTPLMKLVRRDPELVRLLLQAGANPNREGPDGFSALELARYYHSDDIAELMEAY
jgi:ankyrin repeat protein